MNIIPLLVDVGLFVYFIASFPQLKLAYENRHELKDLSITTHVLYLIGGCCLFIPNLTIGGPLSPYLNVFAVCRTAITLYWIIDSKKRQREVKLENAR